MNAIIYHLLYTDAGSRLNNIALLAYRVLFALELFRVHSMKKFRVQNGRTEVLPDPLHLPPSLNHFIATFSDTVVPFLLVIGIGTRLIVLPAIGVTAVGYFVVHRRDSPEVRDVPYVYTLSLLFLLILGAGSYSADAFILYLCQ